VPERYITLGHVNGVFGLQGWVKVFSHTRPRDAIFQYGAWHLGREGGDRRVLELKQGRVQGKGLVAKLQDVSDPDAASALVGWQIQVPRDQLPGTEAGEYYWADLIGLRVVNLDGESLGTVAYLVETGANDVLVTDGERERLIPLLFDRVVKEVDLESGEMRVDWDPEF
jgi:16S rRNA processing protein RimM